MSDRRGVGPAGPVPITVEAMQAYTQLTDRKEYVYKEQLLHFVPLLDREYLRDFYDRQQREMEKNRKKAERPTKPASRAIGRKR